MTKKEMAEAMLAGKTLVNTNGTEAYYDNGREPPFAVRDRNGNTDTMMGYWRYSDQFHIKPEPKKRPMTREEVLGFLANAPGIVARSMGREEFGAWRLVGDFLSNEILPWTHQWATIDAKGKIGEPHAFEVDA